jgi:ATP-dependent RNA helicase DDX51/DBP6
MNLFQPKLFIGTHINTGGDESSKSVPSSKNVTPTGLQEKMIITTSDKKPLVIWYLIEKLGYRRMFCFTGSVDNTHRLCFLLSQIKGLKVGELASNLAAKKRDQVIKDFSEGKLDIVVCSDLMARGMDVPDINYVVCYDPPSNETSYIHRIGRTARAGKKGVALTLLTGQQTGHFQAIIRRAHYSKKPNSKGEYLVEKMVVNKNHLKPFVTLYKEALTKLRDFVRKEQNSRVFPKKRANDNNKQ